MTETTSHPLLAHSLPEIRFYHLTTSPLERALPPLVEKIAAGGFRALIKMADEVMMDKINALLWTYNPNSFLPHGSRKDSEASVQPIYITETSENPNQANLLLVTDGSSPDHPERFTRILDMFDGMDEQAVQAARARWKRYKEQEYTLEYWQQTAEGGWSRKA